MLNKNQVDIIAYNMCQHAKLDAVCNIRYDFDLRKLSKIRMNMIKRAFQLGLNDTGGDTAAIVRSISEGLGIKLPEVPNGRDKYWGGYVNFRKDCGVDLSRLMEWASALWKMQGTPKHQYARTDVGYTERKDGSAYFHLTKGCIPSNWQQRHKLYKELIVVDDSLRDKLEEAIKFTERGGIISLSFDEESEGFSAETNYEIR